MKITNASIYSGGNCQKKTAPHYPQGAKKSIAIYLQNHIKSKFEKHIRLRIGASLFIKKIYYDNDYTEAFESKSAMLSFWFCCSGIKESVIAGMRDNFMMNKGLCGIFMGQKGFEGYSKFPAQIPWQIVSIHIEPSSLFHVIGEGYDELPQACRNLVEGKSSGCFERSMFMTPKIQVAVDQIMNCPLENAGRQLYYEGKSLELIACLLDNIKDFEQKSNLVPIFCSAEIERIHYAGKLLVDNMINPSSLMELARATGMHHSKLNRGFQIIFGNTVFGYLKKIRLEKAMHLLKTGDMSCAEVSFSVGYSSLSHFSKIFRDQYGANPSSYIRRISPVRVGIR